MTLMRLTAPAKINLFLRVGARRADGFHPLVSWMVTVALFDNLEFERARTPGIRLASQGAIPAPADPSNLVVRAAEALAQAAQTHAGGVNAHLLKRIPIGAGLGGGSSDAAHTLLALNRLWGLEWPLQRLHGIAATLGSDVPFFLHGPSALCAGRGEHIAPLAAPAVKYAVLILPPGGLSTPAVYRRFDELASAGPLSPPAASEAALGEMSPQGEPPEVRALLSSPPMPPSILSAAAGSFALPPAAIEPWASWTALPAVALLRRLSNDLEAPAFSLRPELGRLRQAIEQSQSRIVRMSGSGSTLFTLADSETEAQALASDITARHDVPAHAVRLCPALADDLG